jgi:hypothetical protein
MKRKTKIAIAILAIFLAPVLPRFYPLYFVLPYVNTCHGMISVDNNPQTLILASPAFFFSGRVGLVIVPLGEWPIQFWPIGYAPFTCH